MSDGAAARIRAVARDVFGWPELRTGQDEAMAAAVAGRDVLAVMPTGAGKSAIYQIPALLRDGPTLVVSPLLALQRDQLTALHSRGETAVRVSSAETAANQERALDAVDVGDAEFLFLAPEQLARPEVLDRVAYAKPSLVAVDEAHCVSAWGHDFRPDYLRLGPVIEQLRHPTVVALTATASPPVRDDIVSVLGLRDPLVVARGFDRPNIELEVQRFLDEPERREAVLLRAAGEPKPGLVYTATRKDADEYATRLDDLGLSAAAYHSGHRKRERAEVHEAFLRDELDVVVATSAFGMGIDKPNVRFVLHAALPNSPDSYLQEFGRGGRDGKPALALLLYRAEDQGLQRYFTGGIPEVDEIREVMAAAARQPADRKSVAERTGFGPRKVTRLLSLLESVGALHVDPYGSVRPPADSPAPPEDPADAAVAEAERHQRVDRSRVEMMRGYAETLGCRRQYLLGYFGEHLPHPCGHCDTCGSGSATEQADLASSPYPLNARVRHDEYGDGTVMRYESDRIVVLFDDSGYRTLALDVVESQDLLATL